MHYFVYILEMRSGCFYTGSTTNLKNRIVKHFKGVAAQTTKGGGYKRILLAERYPNRYLAERREKQLKGWSHAKKVALATGNLEDLKKLSKSRTSLNKS